MKNLNWVLAGLLIFVAIDVSALVVYTTTTRALTAVESILWQVFVLTAGLAGSFIFGQQSAKEAGKEILKPHARNAVRHLISLFKSISRAGAVIDSSQKFESIQDYHVIRAYLIGVITEQLATADDAVENWRDILGEELEDLIERLQEERITPEEVEDLIKKLVPENTQEDK